jgi:hypothetical protein
MNINLKPNRWWIIVAVSVIAIGWMFAGPILIILQATQISTLQHKAQVTATAERTSIEHKVNVALTEIHGICVKVHCR